MLKWGINKLNQVRLEMPSAGGLVIAHNIEMAQYMCDILEILEGEKPTSFTVKLQILNKKLMPSGEQIKDGCICCDGIRGS